MRLLGRSTSLRRMAGTPDAFDPFWYTSGAGGFSQSGMRVTPELAMTLSAVWFGATFLARNLGSLPCEIMQHTGPNRKQIAPNHALFPVVNLSPNVTQDAFQWVEQGVGHIALRGNWLSKIVPGARGYVDQLNPINPDLAHAGRLPNGRLQYTVRSTQGQPPEILTQDQVFHVRGYSTDGVWGLSMIAYGANSIGVSLAQDTFTGRFFKQGVSAAMAVEHPGVLGEVGGLNLRASINAYLTGLENAGGILILEEGAKLNKIGVSPEDAQLLGMKDHSIREIARWFGLPSYLFSDMGKPPTYASSVQFAEDLVRYTFRPLARRIEMAMRTQLLIDPDNYSAEFNMAELLRGDIAARAAFYHLAILDGWMNRNEARAKENMNPEDGLDDFWEPMNVRDANAPDDPMSALPAAPLPPSGNPDDDESTQEQSAHARIMALDRGPRRRQTAGAVVAESRGHDVRATILALEAANRVVRKEVAAVAKGAKDHANDPVAWSGFLKMFYADHAKFVATSLHVPLSIAREYSARQGLLVANAGVSVLEDFEATAGPELATLALDGQRRSA